MDHFYHHNSPRSTSTDPQTCSASADGCARPQNRLNDATTTTIYSNRAIHVYRYAYAQICVTFGPDMHAYKHVHMLDFRIASSSGGPIVIPAHLRHLPVLSHSCARLRSACRITNRCKCLRAKVFVPRALVERKSKTIFKCCRGVAGAKRATWHAT